MYYLYAKNKSHTWHTMAETGTPTRLAASTVQLKFVDVPHLARHSSGGYPGGSAQDAPKGSLHSSIPLQADATTL